MYITNVLCGRQVWLNVTRKNFSMFMIYLPISNTALKPHFEVSLIILWLWYAKGDSNCQILHIIGISLNSSKWDRLSIMQKKKKKQKK